MPPEFERELRELYTTLAELLKLFYKQFPIVTKERKYSATRMLQAMSEFKKVKIEPFEVCILYLIECVFNINLA